MDNDKVIAILRTAGTPENVIAHCEAVKVKAIEIASQIGEGIDVELIAAGALLHDIGRSVTHSIRHAIEGVRIAQALALPCEIIGIIENHIGAGISYSEAVDLGLPPKDYYPQTREQIIVSYADNLTNGTKHMSFEECYERIKRTLGASHPALPRYREMHALVYSWLTTD